MRAVKLYDSKGNHKHTFDFDTRAKSIVSRERFLQVANSSGHYTRKQLEAKGIRTEGRKFL